MSFSMNEGPTYGRAETRFREAFARLRMGAPIRIPKDSPVSQNNVAKEAGKNPTALRKERFPALVREIQVFVEQDDQRQTPSLAQQLTASRAKNVTLRVTLDTVTAERDRLLSELESMRHYLLEQARVIAREGAGSVSDPGVVQAGERFRSKP